MSTLIAKLSDFWAHGSGRIALAAVCAHSVSISIGISQAYSAILIPQLTQSDHFNITAEESSWLASFGAITNPVGSILSGILGEYLGRKMAITLSGVPFVVGWLCLALGKDIWWLYSGRLITGIAAGMSVASYTYVAEVATPSSRGILQAMGPLLASFGILLTYLLGAIIRWNVLAFINIGFGVFTIVSIQLVPESPSYLLRREKFDRCLSSLRWLLRNDLKAKEEYSVLSSRVNQKCCEDSSKNLYLTAETIKPFLILTTLFFLQEMSGIYTVLFYAVNFIQDSKLEVNEKVASILIGGIRLFMSIVAAILITKFGRKKLLIVSGLGMAFSMCSAAVYFKYHEIFAIQTISYPYIPLICILWNVVFSMFGMLPIPWILVGELFPPRVRSIAGGMVICLAQLFIFATVKVYYNMNEFLTYSGTLLIFSLSAIIAAFFCRIFLPETKDKSLSEIEQLFKKSSNQMSNSFNNVKFKDTCESNKNYIEHL